MNPTRRLVLATAVVLVVVVLGSAGWLHSRMAQPRQLLLRFHATVGDAPLVLNEARYPNPGGEGRYAVRDFQFFLSNIRLVGPRGAWTEPESYHLLRFDGAEPVFAITLPAVPREAYTRIEFGLGVDPAANGSVAMHGDLDPNGRMAWTWDVGYKFVLFEGSLQRDDATRPLVYHVGFDANYTPLAFALRPGSLDAREPALDFRVDVARLFEGDSTIDLAALPTVKFDRADAARIARNCARMITAL